MTRKKTSKKAAGARLNKEGRLSPLDVFQAQMEYYNGLASEEIAKGNLGDREKIDDYSLKAQKAAEAMAPYRHARLSPTDEQGSRTTTKVIRVVHTSPTIEDWQKQYCTERDAIEAAISDQATSDKADELIQRAREARGGVPIEIPEGKLN